MTERIGKAYYLICEQMAAKYGEPLPKKICTIGDEDGWLIKLNSTSDELDNVLPYHANVSHADWPVGIINPFAGTMMSGAEDDLIEWLEQQQEPAEESR